jgi:putative transposase
MKKRFSEEQIIKVLEEAKSGLKVEELCRKHGISTPTYYSWKAKFGGMMVAEVRRLKALELENERLKRLVAEQALDIVALKDVVTRKW